MVCRPYGTESGRAAALRANLPAIPTRHLRSRSRTGTCSKHCPRRGSASLSLQSRRGDRQWLWAATQAASAALTAATSRGQSRPPCPPCPPETRRPRCKASMPRGRSPRRQGGPSRAGPGVRRHAARNLPGCGRRYILGVGGRGDRRRARLVCWRPACGCPHVFRLRPSARRIPR